MSEITKKSHTVFNNTTHWRSQWFSFSPRATPLLFNFLSVVRATKSYFFFAFCFFQTLVKESFWRQNLSAVTLNTHQKMYLKVLVLYLLTWIATAAYQSQKQPKSGKGFGSSVIFPVSGNVYPKGYFYVTISIGQPPKPYFLDIDTGSDLTWLQCDAPCTKCSPAPHGLYKPKRNVITCLDPMCTTLHGPGNHNCGAPHEQCDYEIDYADYGSSLGVLVKDSVPLNLTNGTTVAPQLAFGCGYNQEVEDPTHLPYTDGVLGLGLGNSSILKQLSNLGLTRNVVGHCLSGQGGGFLFFGDDFLPNSGIVWKPMLGQSKHYSLGSAGLQFGGQATNIKDLQIIFDSGSTYTYFSSQAYSALVSMIKGDLNGKQLKVAAEDKSLPLCWKGGKPFKSIRDAVSYFKPLVLSFSSGKNVQFQLRPESYLIVTEKGNVCLGILNGGEVGLGNINVIGDISLQDKLVIYDNERQQIGWAPANCNRLPNTGRDYSEDFCLPYPANDGFLEDVSASFGFETRRCRK